MATDLGLFLGLVGTDIERPICAGFLVSLLFLVVVLMPGIRQDREKAFQEH
jgi:hypothetical protein